MKPIPKDGVGFKIFTVIRAGETLHPLMSPRGLYRYDENGFAVWNDKIEHKGGFCFFCNKRNGGRNNPTFQTSPWKKSHSGNSIQRSG
jgi:hypothetical protein